jgi:hypothetical protein
MVLHHFGESTLEDIKDVERECVKAGAKTVVVAGDIAKPETAKGVSVSGPAENSTRIMCTYRTSDYLERPLTIIPNTPVLNVRR